VTARIYGICLQAKMNLQNENCSTFYKDPGFKIPKVVTAYGENALHKVANIRSSTYSKDLYYRGFKSVILHI
jgi:predicted NUDIX family NTP pyrophosphohydrolase